MKTTTFYSERSDVRATTLIFGNVNNVRGVEDGRVQGDLAAREIFCLQVYDRELFGATRWALYIAEAVSNPREASFIPNVMPGGRILLFVKGWERVAAALQWIKSLSKKEDPTKVHPSRYIRQHAIQNTDFTPRVPPKPTFSA